MLCTGLLTAVATEGWLCCWWRLSPSSDCHLSIKKCEAVMVCKNLTGVKSYMVLYAFPISIRHVKCFKCEFGLKNKSAFRDIKKIRFIQQRENKRTPISHTTNSDILPTCYYILLKRMNSQHGVSSMKHFLKSNN